MIRVESWYDELDDDGHRTLARERTFVQGDDYITSMDFWSMTRLEGMRELVESQLRQSGFERPLGGGDHIYVEDGPVAIWLTVSALGFDLTRVSDAAIAISGRMREVH